MLVYQNIGSRYIAPLSTMVVYSVCQPFSRLREPLASFSTGYDWGTARVAPLLLIVPVQYNSNCRGIPLHRLDQPVWLCAEVLIAVPGLHNPQTFKDCSPVMGAKLLKSCAFCPQNGAAVLKGCGLPALRNQELLSSACPYRRRIYFAYFAILPQKKYSAPWQYSS